jgi:ComF family protein
VPILDRRTACAICAEPLTLELPEAADASSRCGACASLPPAFDRLLTPWRYGPPIDAVIQAYKFRRLDYLGEHLAAVIAESCHRALALEEAPLVSHVPLHWRRRLDRGYDQAREIALPLARALGLPFRSTLRRRRGTPAQSSLDRGERLANLRGVFKVTSAKHVAGRRILLVDDVATTGATLDAAARTLKAAGAREVIGLVAARTPLLRSRSGT